MFIVIIFNIIFYLFCYIIFYRYFGEGMLFNIDEKFWEKRCLVLELVFYYK